VRGRPQATRNRTGGLDRSGAVDREFHPADEHAASSLARNIAARATSSGRESRPSGIVAMNLARFAGVSSTPMKASSRAVSPITGQIALTRIASGPGSTAIDVESRLTAPLLAL
jgi:hypothetical protein